MSAQTILDVRNDTTQNPLLSRFHQHQLPPVSTLSDYRFRSSYIPAAGIPFPTASYCYALLLKFPQTQALLSSILIATKLPLSWSKGLTVEIALQLQSLSLFQNPEHDEFGETIYGPCTTDFGSSDNRKIGTVETSS